MDNSTANFDVDIDNPGYPLALSFLAGLSTAIGGVIAIARKPDDGLLAFLLGLALGVMALLATLELYISNGMRQGFGGVTIAAGLGVVLYRVIHAFFPEIEANKGQESDGPLPASNEASNEDLEVASPNRPEGGRVIQRSLGTAQDFQGLDEALSQQMHIRKPSMSGSRLSSIPPAELWRLGLLMAFTMTLHNMPEGFAVAFTAMTDLGPVMALSIALHNIPEGIIVAAPVYAATGNRWKAFGIALASGMAEPLGALLALLLFGPFLTPVSLDYMLSFVGGVMIAVCVMELWPEARKCKNDWKMAQGIVLGGMLMGFTLTRD